MNRILCCILLLTTLGPAQQQSAGDPQIQLLDRLAGDWVLQGTIGKKQTTHDVHADWVLNREYLRLHEISREKNASGGPAYEAIVFISWDPKSDQYTCLWLDSTEGGGLSAEGLAHAKKAEHSIPFIFTTSPSESIHNTFNYDQTTDTWTWVIDNVSNGRNSRFADVKLTRTKQSAIRGGTQQAALSIQPLKVLSRLRNAGPLAIVLQG